MTNTPKPQTAGFYGLGIAPKLLSTLDKLKFETPTPIQHQAIPAAVEGKDLVGIAQTGTGKTIAFAIPMIQRLAAGPGKGLVLVPTRELALQVSEVYKQFAPSMGVTGCALIGGEAISRQISDLRTKPRVIIATPGRLLDHLSQNTVRLDDVRVLVLDEADRMFDMGFAPQIERVLRTVPKDRQTMLFSATMPDDIMKLAGQHMKLPIRVEVARSGTAAEKVDQQLYVVNRDAKPDLLNKLLQVHGGSVLLFVRTKHNARKIKHLIAEMGHSAAEIHSNRSLQQRKDALEGFKTGRYRVLVATDIAARGIDVTGIELVINYDLPEDEDNYVHRIGRTGRAGKAGKAVSFAAPDQGKEVKGIERLIRRALPIATHPDIPAAKLHGQTINEAQQRPRSARQQRPQSRPQHRQMPRPQSRHNGHAQPKDRGTLPHAQAPRQEHPSHDSAARRPEFRRSFERPQRRAGGMQQKPWQRPAKQGGHGRRDNSAYFPEDIRRMEFTGRRPRPAKPGPGAHHTQNRHRPSGTRYPGRKNYSAPQQDTKTPSAPRWFDKFLKRRPENE